MSFLVGKTVRVFHFQGFYATNEKKDLILNGGYDC
jgi:hypothetical protein